MTEVNIVGRNFNDILLYLLSIIKQLDKNAIIRDMTRRHEFYSAIPRITGIDPQQEVIDYRGMGYTFGERNGRNPSIDCEYDICFRLYDEDMLPENKGYVLVVTDESKSTADCLENLVFEGFIRSFFLIKNYTGIYKKQFEDFIKHTRFQKIYTIPININDAKMSVLAEYRDEVVFDGISGYLKEALAEIISVIFTDLSAKQIQRVLKQAMKGGA